MLYVKFKKYNNIEDFVNDKGSSYGIVLDNKRDYMQQRLFTKFIDNELVAVYSIGHASTEEYNMYNVETMRFSFAVDTKNKIVLDTHCNSVPNNLFKDYKIYKDYTPIVNRVSKCISNLLDKNIKPSGENETKIIEIARELLLNGETADTYKWSINTNLIEKVGSDLIKIFRLISDDQFVADFSNVLLEKDKYIKNSYYYYLEVKGAMQIIKDNPPQEFLKQLDIIKKLINEKDCKTYTVYKEDGEHEKVDGKMFFDYGNAIFKTVKGWNTIKLSDVKKITYGRKILYCE